MKSFDNLIHGLSELLGEPLIPDLNDSVTLLINEKLKVQLEAESTGERILIFCKITELPPGKFRENVLRDALKANHMYNEHEEILAYIAKDNQLVLFQHVYSHSLTAELLYGHIALFMKRAESWKEAIDSGKTSPIGTGEFPAGKSAPNIFGFK